MGFLEWIFGFKSFYGSELFEHLKGWDDEIMDYNAAYFQFPSIFWTIFSVTIVLWLLYYYIINNPRMNRWWCWLICLTIVCLFAYGWGYHVVEMDINNGTIAPSLINQISTNNAVMFGFYDAILAFIIFLILTVFLRHGSRNCKHSPWKSLLSKIIR